MAEKTKRIMSDEHKEKIRQAKLGTHCSAKTKRKMSLAKLGKKFTEEHKNKISMALIGRHLSPKTEFKQNHKHSRKTLRKISISLMGRKAWNKDKIHLPNELNPMWKGDKVGYNAIHTWVRRKKGSPKKCATCRKTKGKIHWANINHKYHRNLDDYISLCVSCHKKYDLKNNLLQLT